MRQPFMRRHVFGFPAQPLGLLNEGPRRRTACRGALGLQAHFLTQAAAQKNRRALGQGLSGAEGGMRGILNTIADAFRRRALSEYVDHVFYEHINVLSKEDNLALSRAFFERFGPVLARFGMEVSEDMFAWNTRAALDYHRQVLEHVIGIAKKI